MGGGTGRWFCRGTRGRAAGRGEWRGVWRAAWLVAVLVQGRTLGCGAASIGIDGAESGLTLAGSGKPGGETRQISAPIAAPGLRFPPCFAEGISESIRRSCVACVVAAPGVVAGDASLNTVRMGIALEWRGSGLGNSISNLGIGLVGRGGEGRETMRVERWIDSGFGLVLLNTNQCSRPGRRSSPGAGGG